MGGGKCQYGGGFAQLEGEVRLSGVLLSFRSDEPFGFCPRAVQPCFEAVVAVVETAVDFGVDDVGEADDAEAAVYHARADADLQEDKACFDASGCSRQYCSCAAMMSSSRINTRL